MGDGQLRTATSTFTQLLSPGVPRASTSTFTQLLSSFSSMLLYVHRDYKDYQGLEEPRTATSTFTQLLSSELSFSSMLLYVHRDHKDYQGLEEPRTATSTFTQPLSSVSVFNRNVCIHRHHYLICFSWQFLLRAGGLSAEARHRVLRHPGVRPIRADRHPILGLLLARRGGHTCQVRVTGGGGGCMSVRRGR